jgi:hypothetical protein
VQVHHLLSLGGWNDVIYLSIYLSTNQPVYGERPTTEYFPMTMALKPVAWQRDGRVSGHSAQTIRVLGLQGSRGPLVYG